MRLFLNSTASGLKKIKKNLILFIFLFCCAFSVAADESKSEDTISGDIFGKGGGYIHPSLTVGGIYSDNIFNTEKDKRDDFIWVISPEIWLALPGTRIKLVDLPVSPKTPAGFTLSRSNPEAFRRYQTYLSYGADFYRYTDYTEEDKESHRLEGLFQYNFRGGLSIELVGQYVDTFDPVGVAPFTRHDEYTEGLFNAILSYDITEKFKLRLDFTHIDHNYEDRPLDEIPLIGRDRQDNGYSGYLFFKIRPKTSIFAQYRFIDIDYDINVLADDSDEHHYFGGVQWRLTPKSKGSLKLGYGVKDFHDNEELDDESNFIFEGEFRHLFTPKTSLSLAGFGRTDETTIYDTNYVLTYGLSAQYNQRITEKLTGHLFFTYAWDQYQGEITFDNETKEREDDLIRIRPSLRYEFTRWLMADAAYMYTKRESNFSIFDFSENRFSLRISVSLYNRSSEISDN